MTSASATFTSAFTALRSEIVISVVPGWFWTPMTTISPGSTSSRVTMPSIGAVTSVLFSESRARVRSATAWVTRRCAAAAACCARSIATVAADTWAEEVPSAVTAASKSAAGSSPALRSSRARLNAAAACVALDCASASAGLCGAHLRRRGPRVGFDGAERRVGSRRR